MRNMKGKEQLEAKLDEDGWDWVEVEKEDMWRWWEEDEDNNKWDVVDDGGAGERDGMQV